MTVAIQSSYIDTKGGMHGQVANAIFGRNTMSPRMRTPPTRAMQIDLQRPFFDDQGRRCVQVHNGRWTVEKGERRGVREDIPCRDLSLNYDLNVPVWNQTTLSKESWVLLDQVMLRASRYELRFYADVSAMNTFGGFNGMGRMVLEHQTVSDAGEAIQDMTGLTPGRNDQTQFQLQGMPLPITHSDFQIPGRFLAISGNGGEPADVTLGENSGRRVAEMIEAVSIGTRTGVIYGGNSTQVGGYGRTSQCYGALNFPPRIVKTNLTVPLGTNPDATVADVLAMRQSLYNVKYKGPYMLYHSNDWDNYLDNDYARAVVGANSIATSATLRERLRKIPGVLDVKRLDMLFASAPVTDQTSGSYLGPGGETDASLKPFTLIMVQMTDGVVRAINGLDLTTVQWETRGGFDLSFMVLAIQALQWRADFYGNTGACVATTT